MYIDAYTLALMTLRKDAPAAGKDSDLVRKFKAQMAAFKDPAFYGGQDDPQLR